MNILAMVTGFMMQFANAQFFSTTTPGMYYEVSSVYRSPSENKTYSVWSRYDVFSKYDTHKDHFHVEITDGMPTVEQLVEIAQSRCDKGITAISGVK